MSEEEERETIVEKMNRHGKRANADRPTDIPKEGLEALMVGFGHSHEGGHSRVTDIQPLHERMFEPKPYFLSTFRDRQVFI